MVSRLFRLRVLALATLVSFAAFIGAACTPDHPQSTFDSMGPVAQRQEDLFVLIFIAALIVFLIVGGFLLFTVLKFRNRAGTPRQTHGNTRLEVILTIIPAIVLIIVAVPTISALFYIADPPSGEAVMDINVTGKQWFWNFEYPDAGVTTSNELHIPVGENIRATLRSDDVIHSFWIPKLAGKVDVIPTRANDMWFKADEVGVYWGQCAEFCGIAHAHMRFQVVVETQADFDAWVAKQAEPAAEPSSELAQRGHDLVTARGCIGCHTIDGIPGAVGTIGPNLTHVGSRTRIASGILERTPENVAAWLRDPQEAKPGNDMPNLNLSEDDISALVAYLDGLK
ncbi:MAG: cytochrome c oxidase subunit 2 [Chloroflexi bacterium]|nr:MAG: cytochrome c oxidase subunit 2 [Chloroflexota bacterium]